MANCNNAILFDLKKPIFCKIKKKNCLFQRYCTTKEKYVLTSGCNNCEVKQQDQEQKKD